VSYLPTGKRNLADIQVSGYASAVVGFTATGVNQFFVGPFAQEFVKCYVQRDVSVKELIRRSATVDSLRTTDIVLFTECGRPGLVYAIQSAKGELTKTWGLQSPQCMSDACIVRGQIPGTVTGRSRENKIKYKCRACQFSTPWLERPAWLESAEGEGPADCFFYPSGASITGAFVVRPEDPAEVKARQEENAKRSGQAAGKSSFKTTSGTAD
jgi:hypothetical protein